MSDAINEAIRGLLETRDFLGLQLDYAQGNVPDEDFERRSTAFLHHKPVDNLGVKVLELQALLQMPLAADAVADMFRCSLLEAVLALDDARRADPVLAALLAAPEDDEPLTAADELALAEGRRDHAAGRLLSHEEVRQRLGMPPRAEGRAK